MSYLAVAGKPREALDLEDGATVKDILAAANVTRHEGEVIVVGSEEVGDDYEPIEGQTIVFIPPVSLG